MKRVSFNYHPKVMFPTNSLAEPIERQETHFLTAVVHVAPLERITPGIISVRTRQIFDELPQSCSKHVEEAREDPGNNLAKQDIQSSKYADVA